MAGLLYFVPTERENLDAHDLEGLGLGHAVSEGFDCRHVAAGPGDKAGVVVTPKCPAGEEPRSGYYPDSQVWEGGRRGCRPETVDRRPEGRIPDLQPPASSLLPPAFSWWLGCERGSTGSPHRPGPPDLARAEQFGGHLVKLADGNEWLVPVARYVSGGSAFPRALKLVDGKWTPGAVKARYGWLWEQACRLWDILLEHKEGGEITLEDEVGIAVEALAVNYRLSAHEMSFLELLDTQTEAKVVLALVDWPSVRELQKKSQRADPSTGPGDSA